MDFFARRLFWAEGQRLAAKSKILHGRGREPFFFTDHRPFNRHQTQGAAARLLLMIPVMKSKIAGTVFALTLGLTLGGCNKNTGAVSQCASGLTVSQIALDARAMPASSKQRTVLVTYNMQIPDGSFLPPSGDELFSEDGIDSNDVSGISAFQNDSVQSCNTVTSGKDVFQIKRSSINTLELEKSDPNGTTNIRFHRAARGDYWTTLSTLPVTTSGVTAYQTSIQWHQYWAANLPDNETISASLLQSERDHWNLDAGPKSRVDQILAQQKAGTVSVPVEVLKELQAVSRGAVAENTARMSGAGKAQGQAKISVTGSVEENFEAESRTGATSSDSVICTDTNGQFNLYVRRTVEGPFNANRALSISGGKRKLTYPSEVEFDTDPFSVMYETTEDTVH